MIQNFTRLSDFVSSLMVRIAAALGLLPFTQVTILGTNSDLDTSEDILCWPPGTAYTLPTAAAQVYISSSSASDTTQVVSIEYLTSAYAQKTVTMTLVGQTKTAVTGATDVFRVNRVTVSAATAGNVWVYFDDTVTAGVPQTDAKKLSYVPLSYMASRQCLYTVPAGYYGLLMKVSAAVGSSATGKSFDMHCYKKQGTAPSTLITAMTPVSTGLSQIERANEMPWLLTAGTDFYMKTENASADNTYAEGEAEIWLIPSGKVDLS